MQSQRAWVLDGPIVANRVPAKGSRRQSTVTRPLLADFDELATAKCSNDCPALMACISHCGIAPLPSHVSPKALRYRTDFARIRSSASAAARSTTLIPTCDMRRRRYEIMLSRFRSSICFPFKVLTCQRYYGYIASTMAPACASVQGFARRGNPQPISEISGAACNSLSIDMRRLRVDTRNPKTLFLPRYRSCRMQLADGFLPRTQPWLSTQARHQLRPTSSASSSVSKLPNTPDVSTSLLLRVIVPLVAYPWPCRIACPQIEYPLWSSASITGSPGAERLAHRRAAHCLPWSAGAGGLIRVHEPEIRDVLIDTFNVPVPPRLAAFILLRAWKDLFSEDAGPRAGNPRFSKRSRRRPSTSPFALQVPPAASRSA